MGARCRPSIMVVGSRGQSTEVVGGHHRRASMVVLGTRGRWWAVVAVSRSSWWVVANVDGGGGCEKRAVVTCDIAFFTSTQLGCVELSKCVATSSILQHCVAILLLGSVPLLVYPPL